MLAVTRDTTQVVLLTPPGRGAIASLELAGPTAAWCVGELLHRARSKPLDGEPCSKILHGRWRLADVGEEVVVCRRAENRFEIHCHGGDAAARAIIESLVARGCLAVDWRDWLLETSSDPIAAAARIALADAPTERTAAILYDQYTGALSRAIDELHQASNANDAARAQRLLDELLAHSTAGLHLVHPWRVVLAGRPNVGKSSLINALVGYARAIVHPAAGTTRDIVTAETAIDGWPIELADTAGLHASTDPIESAGVQLARERLARADLAVLVFDVTQAWSSEDSELSASVANAIIVGNKCDLARPSARPPNSRPTLPTSALTGEGVESLASEIARRLVPRPPAARQAVPFLPSHVATLKRVRHAVARSELELAGRLAKDLRARGDRQC